ncbi:unnamed protein product [Laminaria digitata]
MFLSHVTCTDCNAASFHPGCYNLVRRGAGGESCSPGVERGQGVALKHRKGAGDGQRVQVDKQRVLDDQQRLKLGDFIGKEHESGRQVFCRTVRDQTAGAGRDVHAE